MFVRDILNDFERDSFPYAKVFESRDLIGIEIDGSTSILIVRQAATRECVVEGCYSSGFLRHGFHPLLQLLGEQGYCYTSFLEQGLRVDGDMECAYAVPFGTGYTECRFREMIPI